MKKFKLSNLITIAIVIFALYQLVPRTLRNLDYEGQELKAAVATTIPEQVSFNFPPAGKSIVIFWATWCAPCKLEMNRLKTSVEAGKIPKDKIFALNPFETRETILKFLKTEKYPFIFIEAPEFTQAAHVEATPTTLFMEGNKILSRSSGLSLTGIWRAEQLFR